MWEPVVPVGGSAAERGLDMGLSFFIDDDDGRRVISHTGTQANFRSFMLFDPEQRTAFLMVVNTSMEGSDPDAAGLDALMDAASRLLD
jgi:CubicO group peptidase (beta-lactamase class C family)